jgi:hypothetical protein
VAAGVAVQTVEEFRTGRASGGLRIGPDGFGELTLKGSGAGSYLSDVLDTAQMVDWRRVVMSASLPAGTTAEVSVRTGYTPTPDETWSSWTAPRREGAPIGRSGRYLQYRVKLTASGSALPSVSAVGFTHSGELARDHDEQPDRPGRSAAAAQPEGGAQGPEGAPAPSSPPGLVRPT